MKFFFTIALICTVSLECCSEIFERIPFELIPKVLNVKAKGSRWINVKRALQLRLVCKTFEERIVTTINNHRVWLVQFYDFIQWKKTESILKKEASFLNRLPNLRTHLPFQISEVYTYLFYQDFSFCTNDTDYNALYKKQQKTVFEGLELFDKEAPTKFFTPDHAFHYGWNNHGMNAENIRECNFSQIGFLFFDSNFFPPSHFWSESYHKDTINPVNVLISLSFHPFFQKALKNFILKIPEYCKTEIINPVIVMSAPPMFSDHDFNEHFQNYTKPLLNQRLADNYILKTIVRIQPVIKKVQEDLNPKKPYTLLTKLKIILKNWKYLLYFSTCFIIGYGVSRYFLKYNANFYHVYTSFKACFTNRIVS